MLRSTVTTKPRGYCQAEAWRQMPPVGNMLPIGIEVTIMKLRIAGRKHISTVGLNPGREPRNIRSQWQQVLYLFLNGTLKDA